MCRYIGGCWRMSEECTHTREWDWRLLICGRWGREIGDNHTQHHLIRGQSFICHGIGYSSEHDAVLEKIIISPGAWTSAFATYSTRTIL